MGNKISNLYFTQSTHNEGLGVAWIKIDLPRTPLPDIKITLQGNLQGFNIPGKVAKCSYTYSEINADYNYLKNVR